MRFCCYVYKASRKVYDFIIHVPDFTKSKGLNGSGVKTVFSIVHNGLDDWKTEDHSESKT